MIKITKLKQPKKSVEKEKPNFESRRAKVIWQKIQKELLALSTIKSVSVQVKDIKRMIYSEDPRLISLYAKFNLNRQSYNDEDYITFTKRKDINKSLIYSLISADWIINYDDIINKSDNDLLQEYNELNNRISSLIEIKKTSHHKHKLEHIIKLYQYKLSCLKEYLDSKLNSNSINSTPEEEMNNSDNLSLVGTFIMSESEEPVFTNAFTKVKSLRDGCLGKSHGIYERKK